MTRNATLEDAQQFHVATEGGSHPPQIHIGIHADDPDRLAFRLIDAFTYTVSLTQTGTIVFVGDPQAEPIAAAWNCPVGSNECEIRQECTNKCGRKDPPPTVRGLVDFIPPTIEQAPGETDAELRARAQRQQGDAAPVLIDGFTPEQCRERWEANAAAIESGMATPYALSPDQIAEGKRLHLEARKAGRQ